MNLDISNMKSWSLRLGLIFSFLFPSFLATAQSTSGTSPLLLGFIGFLVFILLVIIVLVADRLLQITAKQVGADKDGVNYSVFPKMKEIFTTRFPDYLSNQTVHNLDKGYDIPLEGDAEGVVEGSAATYAVKPTDFVGLSPIPKVTVEVGSKVKAGDTVFFDKKKPEIKYAAPVSGEVVEVNRGAKRRITEVVILADKDQVSRDYDNIDVSNASREDLVAFLLESGAWPFIRQRPYNVVADPNETPVNIFVSTFDSAPLAPDADLLVKGNEAAFQAGINLLAQLTDGGVHVGLNGNGDAAPADAFINVANATTHWFRGAHPAGNVGVQIHHVAPINKDEVIWTADVQSVITLGRLVSEGKFDTSRLVAVTGAELENPTYVKTHQGANIKNFVAGLKQDHVRYILGDVLTGSETTEKGYLGFFDDQVTVVKEGDYNELFGWLVPIAARPSLSNTFPHFAYPDKFVADTNTHGEKRAFVVTGQYEKVLPMDIYPQHLMKAILVNDFERMEGLGIYELVEEDVALCEFACTSKMNLQEILRDGLDALREQG